MKDDILIAGAGIGGLATALSLHQAGFSVQVFESVPRILPLGVGINLLPHAFRELEELHLSQQLNEAGVACRELAYFTKRGDRIWAEPRGKAAGYRWPQISLYRGALQQILLDAFYERMGVERLHLGMHLVDFSDTEHGIRVTFQPRAEGAHTLAVEGKVLIAADGIHSVARKKLNPNEGLPRWNGAVMWRGVAECEPMLDGATMVMAGHQDVKFVAYPIRPVDVRSGKQKTNFIAELRFDNTQLTDREDWNRRGNLDDFLPAFESFRFDWLNVPEMVRSAPEIWTFPMIDRDPLSNWTFGAMTLLGDAAHPMYPIGSNGASQAILDARVLTGCLCRHREDLRQGLVRYDSIRLPATAKIVLANRQNGPESVMQLVEDRAPDGFRNLEDVVTHRELQNIADHYKQLAGFVVQDLNNRPSLAEIDSQ